MYSHTIAEMAESEMDSLQQRVLRRARELNRLKTGKSSETASFEDVEGGNPRPQQSQLNKEPGNPDTSPAVFGTAAEEAGDRGTTSPDARSAMGNQESERGAQLDGNTSQLWEKFSKMEERMTKSDEQSTDILSRLVFSVAELQKTIETKAATNNSPMEVSAEIDEEEIDDLDALMGSKQTVETESESSEFLKDLEDSYAEKVQFGPAVSEKLGELVNNAIDRPLRDESFKLLEEKHQTPSNCTRMGVPKVNKELWQAFRTARPADLAMQTCQKYMAMAMVPIVKTLDIFVNNGDKEEVKQLTKDAFRILAQGMNANTNKRKDLIRPSIPTKYRKVCGNDVLPSEFLFGDNLEERVDDVEKEEKRSNKLSGHTNNNRNNNNNRSFLGQRRSQGPHGYNKTQRSQKPYHRNMPAKPQGKTMPKGQTWRK